MTDEDKSAASGDTQPAFGGAGSGASEAPAQTDPRAPGGEEGLRVVKICKQCLVSQSGQGRFCARCGSELVPIRAVRDSYLDEVVGGKYTIVSRLGAGGMGEVYLGVNEPLGQRVAVKFLSGKFSHDESIIMRFLNEARSYCKVTHPNAVTLLEYGQHEDGALYLITEFIDGKSLSDTLKETGPFPLDLLVSISSQICEVLSAAHAQGVIHRDLKPDNIMLMPTSRGGYAVKVLDFGIAKIVDDDHAHGARTETGSVFGTPEFMSPEQACGDPIDARADLYAAGVILFYLATGKLPFKGKNKLVVLHKQLHEAPPRPSEARADIPVSPALEDIIMKCLQKDPNKRFQSADELLSALEALDLSDVPRRTHVAAKKADFAGAPTPTAAHENVTRNLRLPAADAPELGYMLTSEAEPAVAPSERYSLGDGAPLGEELSSGEFSSEFSADFSSDRHDLSLNLDEVHAQGRVPGTRRRPGESAPKKLGVVIALGALLAAVALGVLRSGGDAHDETDPNAALTEETDVKRVFTTGQVLGSMAVAEDHLQHADFAAASRALDATYEWLRDEDLDAQARAQRTELRTTITRLSELDEALTRAVQARDCAQAKRVLRSMQDLKEDIEPLRAGRLRRCERPAHHGQAQHSPSAQPPVKPQPPTNAPVAQPASPAPKPATESPKPATESPKPATESPKPATESPKPTTESPKPTTESPKPTTDAPKPSTDAPKSPPESAEPSPADTTPDDPDFALPPRTLD